MRNIPIERAAELLSYEPSSGRLTWRKAKGGRNAGAVAGHLNRDGYLRVNIDGEAYMAHRVAWALATGEQPSMEIDHINGDRADNSLSNLRNVSHGTNLQNMREPGVSNTSGRIGVCWDRRNKRWQAAIRVNGRSRHLGRFDDLEAAASAYVSAKRQLHAGCTI